MISLLLTHQIITEIARFRGPYHIRTHGPLFFCPNNSLDSIRLKGHILINPAISPNTFIDTGGNGITHIIVITPVLAIGEYYLKNL